MATVNLGAIKFNWKGAFNNSTAYAVDDVVSSGGSSYVCIKASQGNAVSNGTYWELMAQAGTNGTDGATIPLTTQGDMLYRDGSGLQRLAKGTAAQELRMNSGATAPEWHTPAVASSDYVKLADVNGAGSSTLALSNIFTSTYDTYKVILTYRQNDKVKFDWRWMNSSGEVSSSNYYGARIGVEADSSGSSRVSSPIWGTNDFGTNQFAQASTSRPAVITGTFYKPTDTNNNKLWKLEHIGFNDSHYIYFVAAGEIAGTGAMTGIQVKTSTGNGFNATTNITAYGIKG